MFRRNISPHSSRWNENCKKEHERFMNKRYLDQLAADESQMSFIKIFASLSFDTGNGHDNFL
jgi:hypothetical protein